MATGFALGSEPAQEPSYAELKARIAELERELLRYRRAEKMRLEQLRLQARSRGPHDWMAM